MQEFHILSETPPNSGTYIETGEVISTNEQDAVNRCIELSQDGTRYGMWVYESVNALHVVRGLKAPTAPAAPAAPVNVDVPYLSQTGAVLNCTMGNWQNEPTTYRYQWKRDGANAGPNGTSANYTVQPPDVGHTATCVVTAINAQGQTTAPPSNPVVVT